MKSRVDWISLRTEFWNPSTERSRTVNVRYSAANTYIAWKNKGKEGHLLTTCLSCLYFCEEKGHIYPLLWVVCGVRPSQVHTTERRRSPMNHCSMLAALVGISCNTGTQTLTVPTKIAVTRICMTVLDKRSHINLEKRRWEGAGDLITWVEQIYVAPFSAGRCKEGSTERI